MRELGFGNREWGWGVGAASEEPVGRDTGERERGSAQWTTQGLCSS